MLATVLAIVAVTAPLRHFFWKPELPVLGEVAVFQLVSDDGGPFDSTTLAGRAWLASFLYTSCPGPCPRLVERLKRVRKEVPPASLAFVSISVDPEKDTPEVLRKYKSEHGIGSTDAWTFVTGPGAQVLALVQRGFLTGVERTDSNTAEGAVSHGTRVALVDGQARIRGFYSTDSDDDLARLAGDAAGLARR